VLSGRGDNLVTPRLFHSIPVHENKRVAGENATVAKLVGTILLSTTNSWRSDGWRETPQWARDVVWWIGGNYGFLQCKKLFPGADNKAVMGLHDESRYLHHRTA